jgi:hypothetical protein
MFRVTMLLRSNARCVGYPSCLVLEPTLVCSLRAGHLDYSSTRARNFSQSTTNGNPENQSSSIFAAISAKAKYGYTVFKKFGEGAKGMFKDFQISANIRKKVCCRDKWLIYFGIDFFPFHLLVISHEIW